MYRASFAVQVAKQLNMTSRRDHTHVTPEQLAPALEEFCVKHMPPESEHLVPSLRELRAAGYHDLARRFRRCTDWRRVSELLKKELPGRGPRPGRSRKPRSSMKKRSKESGSKPPKSVQSEGDSEGLSGTLSTEGCPGTDHVAPECSGCSEAASRATVACHSCASLRIESLRHHNKFCHVHCSFGAFGLLGASGHPTGNLPHNLPRPRGRCRALAPCMHSGHACSFTGVRWAASRPPHRRRMQCMHSLHTRGVPVGRSLLL